MEFKARMKNGDYLDKFTINENGHIVIIQASGALVVDKTIELIIVANESGSFCEFCGAKKHASVSA